MALLSLKVATSVTPAGGSTPATTTVKAANVTVPAAITLGAKQNFVLGPPGVGPQWKGIYSAGTIYAQGDGVTGSNGHNYISLVANVAHDPTTDAGVHWTDTLPSSVVQANTGVYNLGTDAYQNMAIGVPFANIQPGPQPTAAQYNVALGWQALRDLTIGNYNTGIGVTAGQRTTTGIGNTFVGTQAGQANTIGDNNTAVGQTALQVNQTGNNNTAIGWNTLTQTTTSYNTAVGENAATNQTTGQYTTAVGQSAAAVIVSGQGSTHIGFQAGNTGADVNYSTLLGYKTSATAAGGVAIGIDHLGNGATAAAQDVFALGTANHQVQILNNATGAGTPALGANCPAATLTAPYKWFKMMSSDGSTVYVPAWK